MADEDPLEAYSHQLVADVLASAEAENLTAPDAFTQRVLEDLEQAGETENTFTAYYGSNTAEASGFAFNSETGKLDLFLSFFRQAPIRLTRQQVSTQFRRLNRYLAASRNRLEVQLEESTDVYEMTSAVAKAATSATSVRIFFLTNCPTTKSSYSADEQDGLTLHYHVWDLERLERMASSGTLTEPIAVTFDKPLPALRVQGSVDFTVVLAVVPGATLASLYGQYGTRLLELNVRSFLQGRGLVNRGIRRTLLNEPSRFLAFNNGITATASRVEYDDAGAIAAVHDLQIVNGGQTTASLHYTQTRDRADLAGVYVQMKLTIVPSDKRGEIVPEISRYSNTQNRVTLVDFSSNHPFHVAVEKVTRSLWAPARGGASETRWFYERARGQYADALARERTPASQRKFRLLHPASQKFTKSDAAKYLNSWRGLPHIVSRGAEKNFNAFMLAMGDDERPTVDTTACRRLIATAILFRSTDRIVAARDFGGYKINVVAYAVARLAMATERRLDLDRMWRDQALTPATAAALNDLCVPVHRIITRPLRGTNVGEWAKTPECWSRVCDIRWSPPDDVLVELAAQPMDPTAGGRDESGNHGVTEVPAAVWFALAEWAIDTRSLAPWQRQLASRLGRSLSTGQAPGDLNTTEAVRVLEEAVRLGFRRPDR